MYTITLANGKKLENLELNGNNFISAAPVDNAFFDGGLSEVTITDGSIKRATQDTAYSPADYPPAWEDIETEETQ